MISIIVPTYNEAENLKQLIERIDNVLGKRKYEVIVVDDDSSDKTWAVAELLKKRYPVNVIRRKKKRDLSKSVIDGFKLAKGDIMGVMDADLSHSPEDIPKLLDAIEKEDYDFVVGSRLVKGGRVEA